MNVDVTDYYTNGAKDPFGKPTIMSIYERAYGIHYGDKNLDGGGTGAEAMEAISGEETHSVHTFGFTWGFIPWQQHQYTEDEWNDIKKIAFKAENQLRESPQAGTSVRTMELSRRPLTPMEILRLRTQTNKELIGLRKSMSTQ